MKPDRFNIRVYALILDEPGENILISDEQVAGMRFSKFPGGGLEFGEGVRDCLEREVLEELGQEISDAEHFYTTEFFQRSAFRKKDQLLSIYFTAKLKGVPKFRLSEKPFDFEEEKDGAQAFRWQPINKDLVDQLKWPVDIFVAKKLLDGKKDQ